MLQYTTNEGLNSSHFFITTNSDNICLLEFKKLDIESTHFNDDHLQDNVYDMNIVKVSDLEYHCTDLPITIKYIFDKFLNEKDGAIIRVSVPIDKLKFSTIERLIQEDENDHFMPFKFIVDGVAFFFFINIKKTEPLATTIALFRYFYDEYGVVYN